MPPPEDLSEEDAARLGYVMRLRSANEKVELLCDLRVPNFVRKSIGYVALASLGGITMGAIGAPVEACVVAMVAMLGFYTLGILDCSLARWDRCTRIYREFDAAGAALLAKKEIDHAAP